MTIVNWDLLRNPVNWLIVVLMVMLGSIALHYIFAAAKIGAPSEEV